YGLNNKAEKVKIPTMIPMSCSLPPSSFTKIGIVGNVIWNPKNIKKLANQIIIKSFEKIFSTLLFFALDCILKLPFYTFSIHESRLKVKYDYRMRNASQLYLLQSYLNKLDKNFSIHSTHNLHSCLFIIII